MTPKKEKILVTVKTYPNPSTKYEETVCTAGFREDGSWMRLYPVPFRKLEKDNQYKKYDWIELEVKKHKGDPRPESYRPTNIDEIKKVGHIGTKDLWKERLKIVLKQDPYKDLNQLIKDSKSEKQTSLAVFKPKKILKFTYEETDKKWDRKKVKQWEEAHREKRTQMSLFNDFDSSKKHLFKSIKKVPYNFFYSFEDHFGKKSTMRILDWEIGQLYWNILKKTSNEKEACEQIKKKLFRQMVEKDDIWFYLGTIKEFHLKRSKNPFTIVGIVYPKKGDLREQGDLFD